MDSVNTNSLPDGVKKESFGYGWVIPKGDHLLVGAGHDGSSENIVERFRCFRELLSRKHGIDGATAQPARVQTVTRLPSRLRQVLCGPDGR